MIDPGRHATQLLTVASPGDEEDFAPRVGRSIRLMTYNIHNGIGRDRFYNLKRIEAVIRSEQPDIVALQEVDCGMARSRFDDQARLLGKALGMHSFHCITLEKERGGFGNAVLSRFPLLMSRRYDLTHPAGREPRYCLRVDVDLGQGEILHVFNCHLGLATRERYWQQRQMLSDAILLSRDIEHPVVLMGDFNDRPFQVVHQNLRQYFKDAFLDSGRRWGATFRLGWLRWRLDHIYLSPEARVIDSWVRKTPPAHLASDHRPLLAQVVLQWRPQTIHPAVATLP